MSKRLKRRIFDICGLNNLSREDKFNKATAILDDADAKQKICNEIVGVSYRDVEKALKCIIDSIIPKASEEDEEYAELEQECPEKLDPDINLKRKKKPVKMVHMTDKREVDRLVNATNAPIEDKAFKPQEHQSCYSAEEVDALIKGM